MANVVLEQGQKAPDFSLADQHGNTVSLSDFKGNKVVLFVYPAAMTPGCTTETCEFRDSEAALIQAGYKVLGLSKDTAEKQGKFADKYDIPFPLLSDTELETLKAYGAYGEKKNYGKIVQGVIRSTFIIDEDGNIEKALYNVKATGHVGRIRKELGLD